MQVQKQEQERAFAVAVPEIGQHNQRWSYFQQAQADVGVPRDSSGVVGTVLPGLAVAVAVAVVVWSFRSTGHALEMAGVVLVATAAAAY